MRKLCKLYLLLGKDFSPFGFSSQCIVEIDWTPQQAEQRSMAASFLTPLENGIEGQLWGIFSYFRYWPVVSVAQRQLSGIGNRIHILAGLCICRNKAALLRIHFVFAITPERYTLAGGHKISTLRVGQAP
jgi:hypothetical protein